MEIIKKKKKKDSDSVKNIADKTEKILSRGTEGPEVTNRDLNKLYEGKSKKEKAALRKKVLQVMKKRRSEK